MYIPDFQSLMLPLLSLLDDKQEHSMHEIVETLAWEFNLTDAQKQKLLPSGQQSIFENRVGWARTYLKKAGLVESPKRAFVKITDRGLETLKQNLKEINRDFLSQYPEFCEFQNISKQPKSEHNDNDIWNEDWDDIDNICNEECKAEPEPYRFSAKLTNRKELFKKVSNSEEVQNTLIVEAEDEDIIITHVRRLSKDSNRLESLYSI